MSSMAKNPSGKAATVQMNKINLSEKWKNWEADTSYSITYTDKYTYINKYPKVKTWTYIWFFPYVTSTNNYKNEKEHNSHADSCH